ncbi:MAG: PilZ domain-containing protein [Nitrospirae bacterium]|nr:PilZ domain-containing protein [Nitrospirota bacterium]
MVSVNMKYAGDPGLKPVITMPLTKPARESENRKKENVYVPLREPYGLSSPKTGEDITEEVIERAPGKVDLSIGAETLLSVSFNGGCDHMNCRLAGMEKGEFILAKFMGEDFMELLSKDGLIGKEIVVKYVHEGMVYGFITTIIGVLSIPPGFLFTLYPDNVEHYNLRHQNRLNCLLPAKFIVNYVPVRGTVVDINKSGCRYRMNKAAVPPKLSKEQRCDLQVQLPGVEAALHFNTKIKNVTRDKEYVYFGLIFEGLQGINKNVLDNFIDNHQI